MPVRWASVLFLSAALAGCTSSSPSSESLPVRSCSVVVWHRPSSASAHVEVVGDFNAWARPGLTMNPSGDADWLAVSLPLTVGEHEYVIVEDGQWLVDPTVPTTGFHDGTEVTWVSVADCNVPGLRVDDGSGSADGGASVHATFFATSGRDRLDPASIVVKAKDGTAVTPASVTTDSAHGTLALGFAGLSPGKHVLELEAKDVRGRPADPAWATLWIEPTPFDPRDLVFYQVMVDRYRGPGGATLDAPAVPSARAGGTLDGVRAAIESGELAKLGVNALWVSPLYANPDGTFPGADGRPYSSYHGYWPIASRALETRVASESDVDALLASAHARGMRVLFDVVPNHVHAQHPYAQAHLNDGWFNHPDGSCICGAASCDWATHIQDCWFASYLPDLDWQNPVVADQITSDVLWWLDRFDGDGIRIDAVPMMPRAATRRIAAAIRGKYDHPGHSTFLLGENFVGADGYDLLRYQLGPFGLDSEFQFPLMWALRGAIADRNQPMSAIDGAVNQGIADWAGSGAVMATMIGNHDVVRFATESAGDGNGDGWTPAPQAPPGSDVYARQVLALAAVFTLPGAPVVYYGDEVALAGHVDPDSRRVMPAEAALLPDQISTRTAVEALARARACSPALRRGSYRLLSADDEHLAYARELPGADTAVVILLRDASSLEAPLPQIAGGTWIDALTGRAQSLQPELTNAAGAPLSPLVLFPQGSPCAPSAQ
ncbi:MAG TPA: alpha-amylase family glycosyl hydrolase [Polyangiaceae bacterium]